MLDPAVLKYTGEKLAGEAKIKENARKMREEREAAAKSKKPDAKGGKGET